MNHLFTPSFFNYVKGAYANFLLSCILNSLGHPGAPLSYILLQIFLYVNIH